jgi:hypothetical protein
MQLEINAEGVDAVVYRVLQPRNTHDDRQQADRTPVRRCGSVSWSRWLT